MDDELDEDQGFLWEDTLMKKKLNFLIYKEIQNGAVAINSGLLTYGEIFAHFLIY